jgi:dienelactone hydrolase
MINEGKKGKRFAKWKIALLIVTIILLILGICTAIYLSKYYHSRLTIDEYRQQTDLSITEDDSVITIKGEKENGIGIIFYPGGKVEYTAYIPLMEQLAKQGYSCFIPRMPVNLAIFGVDRADDVLNRNPDIEEWYIGGHSLGGAMASKYASENSGKLKGIFFLGAYPYTDLSSTKLTMLSIVGSNDKVVNRKKLDSTKTNAPKGAIYKVLNGGNHANYGDYGKQSGDGKASISRDEQIQQTAEWIMEYCR